MAGKEYSFIMVLHNFSEASENRLSLAPKTSALFHSNAVAQFFSHPCECTVAAHKNKLSFALELVHHFSLRYCTTSQKCPRILITFVTED